MKKQNETEATFELIEHIEWVNGNQKTTYYTEKNGYYMSGSLSFDKKTAEKKYYDIVNNVKPLTKRNVLKTNKINK
jgi:hypothetical protein